MAAKKKTVEETDSAVTELAEQLVTLQEQFNAVVAQRDTLTAELEQAVSDRNTVGDVLDEKVKRHTALTDASKEALAALDYAIGKGLIRAGSPMDKHFDNLRLALKLPV